MLTEHHKVRFGSLCNSCPARINRYVDVGVISEAVTNCHHSYTGFCQEGDFKSKMLPKQVLALNLSYYTSLQKSNISSNQHPVINCWRISDCSFKINVHKEVSVDTAIASCDRWQYPCQGLFERACPFPKGLQGQPSRWF